MSEFYSGMPGPAAIDRLNSLWNLAGSVGGSAAAAEAAAESAIAAAAAYDDFDDRYLGPKAQAPTQDNDGNALVTGALYFNTADEVMYVRTPSATWIPVADAASQIQAANQAATATTQATNASNSAIAAGNSATTAATQATNASNSAGIAQGHATTASTAATNAGDSANAAQGYASTASTAATNAGNSASAAQGHVTTASTAATNAGNSASAAQGYASTASTAATTAGNSAGAALTQANNASTSEGQAAISANEALDYKNLAADWAEKLTEVEPGKFSAKYWAQQASASISGQLVYRGQWSAAGGTYPPTPALGDFYKISTAGTISGVVYAVSDSIIYNGTDWDKIDNTEEAGLVSQVAGKQGDVVLVKGDVGLGNVDNTADSAKPVSAAQQTALDLKADLTSPTFTGVPTAPTAAVGTNTTQLATTAYVGAEIAADAAPLAHVGSGGAAHADVVAGGVAGFMTGADKSKLDGIAAGATANATDAQLRDRSTHTGAQAISTITGLQTALDSKQATLVSGTNIKTVNGNSLLGGGDLPITAGIPEAPINGKDHARKDGAWVEIEPGVSSWNDLTDKPTVIAAGANQAAARTAIGAGTSNFDGDYNNLSNKPTIPAAQQQTDWDAVSGVTSIANKPAVIGAGADQAAARFAIGAAGVNSGNTFNGTQTMNNSLNVLGNVTIKSNSANIQSEATSGGAFFNVSGGWLSTASGEGCNLNLSSGSINNPSNTTGNGGEVLIQSGTNFFTPDKEGPIILRHGYKTPVLELPTDLSFVVNGQAGTAGQVLTSAGAGNPVAWANAPALGTAAALDVPATGNATTSQVVKGDDTRLSDSRNPTGGAGGVLSGTYPNPGFAVDMATQAELNSVAEAKLDKGYATHTDTAGTAGIVWPALQFLAQKFAAAVSIAGAIRFAGVRRYEFESTQSNSGAGHHVAGMDWYVHKGTGNPNMVFAHEAKIDVEVPATLSLAVAGEAQISGNAGTINAAYGHRSRVTGNAGTIGAFTGYRADVTSSSGTLGTVIGYEFPDLSALTTTARSAFVNRDPGAPVLSAGPIIDQSLTYAAPSASGFTVSVPEKRQVLLLTPNAAYAAGTINFPPKATVSDGQTLEITTSQAVSAVTWGANGAAWVLNGPAALAAGSTVRFRYFAALDWWVCISIPS